MPELKSFESDSDNEIEPTAHRELLANVSRLNKTQFIKTPTRTESAAKKNEFQLLKYQQTTLKERSVRNSNFVSVPELVKTLTRTKKHHEIGKQLRQGQQNKKVLLKPLEKPVRERIQRTLAYDRAKQRLNRWTAVITNQQATDHLSFPLDQPTNDLTINDDDKIGPSIKVKSDLMKEMEIIYPELDNQSNNKDTQNQTNNANNQKLSRKEMLLRSKEMRFQRLKESQKNAKAHYQNKIKSKKFHKIMKQQKLKDHIKEFELLQKTNPELALQKLDELEKNRVLERSLLRHKNTGTWAKNRKIRAKYDKNVRKELSQQLSLSRELTQKQPDDNHDDDDDDDDNNDFNAEFNTVNKQNGNQDSITDVFNPWIKNVENQNEKNEVNNAGYRQYWQNRNSNIEALKNCHKKLHSDIVPEKFKKLKSECTTINGWKVEDCIEMDTTKNNGNSMAVNIDELFDDAEDILNQTITRKIKTLQNQSTEIMAKGIGKKIPKTKSSDLSFKKTAKKPNVDEELDETATSNIQINGNEIDNLKELSSKLNVNHPSDSDNINPNNFINVKIHHLNTAMPDIDVVDTDGSDAEHIEAINETRKMTITEAFEDDDIVADFRQDQNDAGKKNEPMELDLTLPGWGSWAGAGIQKQSKKVVLKFNNAIEKRRDENKGDVIIFEKENRMLREHQVRALPFPFTNVKDFEASIRAPIGKDFIPASAHRLLTKPAVLTQMGAIIEPMKQEMLFNKPKKSKSKKKLLRTDKRIAQLKHNGNL